MYSCILPVYMFSRHSLDILMDIGISFSVCMWRSEIFVSNIWNIRPWLLLMNRRRTMLLAHRNREYTHDGENESDEGMKDMKTMSGKMNCLSILSVQIKSSRTRRKFTHEFIYFVVRIGCAWPAQKWSAFFVFLLLPKPENWVAGTTVSILCYDRAQPMNVEITSFIMNSDQFALARLKKQSPWFPYFSF